MCFLFSHAPIKLYRQTDFDDERYIFQLALVDWMMLRDFSCSFFFFLLFLNALLFLSNFSRYSPKKHGCCAKTGNITLENALQGMHNWKFHWARAFGTGNLFIYHTGTRHKNGFYNTNLLVWCDMNNSDIAESIVHYSAKNNTNWIASIGLVLFMYEYQSPAFTYNWGVFECGNDDLHATDMRHFFGTNTGAICIHIVTS